MINQTFRFKLLLSDLIIKNFALTLIHAAYLRDSHFIMEDVQHPHELVKKNSFSKIGLDT